MGSIGDPDFYVNSVSMSSMLHHLEILYTGGITSPSRGLRSWITSG